MNPKISKKVLEKIKKEKISQIPRWHFLFKHWVFWVLFVISILLGALVFSIIVFEISETEFDLFSSYSNYEFLIYFIPIFWIIFLGGFVALAIFGAKHTKKGYKYPPLLIFFASLTFSMLLGTVIYAIGMAEDVEGVMAKKMPFYQGVHQRREEAWSNPKQGRLGGEMVEIYLDEKKLVVKDFSGKIWNVDANNAKLPPNPDFAQKAIGKKIRIIGKQIGPDQFKAKDIRPWIGKKEEEMMKNFFKNNVMDNPKMRKKIRDKIQDNPEIRDRIKDRIRENIDSRIRD